MKRKCMQTFNRQHSIRKSGWSLPATDCYSSQSSRLVSRSSHCSERARNGTLLLAVPTAALCQRFLAAPRSGRSAACCTCSSLLWSGGLYEYAMHRLITSLLLGRRLCIPLFTQSRVHSCWLAVWSPSRKAGVQQWRFAQCAQVAAGRVSTCISVFRHVRWTRGKTARPRGKKAHPRLTTQPLAAGPGGPFCR